MVGPSGRTGTDFAGFDYVDGGCLFKKPDKTRMPCQGIVCVKTFVRHKSNELKQFRIVHVRIQQGIPEGSGCQQFQVVGRVYLVGIFPFDGFALFGEPEFAGK